MGEPRPADTVFVVGGTNGKGSTVAYLEALLSVLGRSTGCYTTPHLFRYNERIRVNGESATDRELIDAFERVEAARGNVSLTYFEFGTLVAIDLMARRSLDCAVMEVGLGGRLDAVNLIDADCAVITPVGLDHQEYLGDDREQIGFEKAGIIRAGAPLILGEPDPPRSILDHARSLGVTPLRCGVDFEPWSSPRAVMRGAHQDANRATALAAVASLFPEAVSRRDELAAALDQTRLPGRLFRMAATADRPELLVDVGHNPMAAAAVAEYLEEQGGPWHCVLGMLQDKDAEAVATKLDRVISRWYCASLDGSRAQSGDQLMRRIAAVTGGSVAQAFESVEEALEAAMSNATAAGCVLVFGSFQTAAAALDRIAASGFGAERDLAWTKH